MKKKTKSHGITFEVVDEEHPPVWHTIKREVIPVECDTSHLNDFREAYGKKEYKERVRGEFKILKPSPFAEEFRDKLKQEWEEAHPPKPASDFTKKDLERLGHDPNEPMVPYYIYRTIST